MSILLPTKVKASSVIFAKLNLLGQIEKHCFCQEWNLEIQEKILLQ